MIQAQTLQSVCQALGYPEAVAFVRLSLKAGYHEFYPDYTAQVDHMVDDSFDRLAGSDPQTLPQIMRSLLTDTFRKDDPSFWFNQIYHHYKTQIKPETDFQQLRAMITGTRLLDYGCGSGYLAARLARGGYQVVTADVLDYRYAEAKHLPFVKMASPTDIPYPGEVIDTALVQAVLHHIDPADLPQVIRRLAQVARHVLIKEDTYSLPGDLTGLAETLADQPLLKRFVGLPLNAQYHALVLIDFYANAIAQGLPEMNMPFEFKPVTEWEQELEANGMEVTGIRLAGFEPGRMHKSCHVWLICKRSKPPKVF